MSHSQFHCIPFILRHAWLNLWDKHMTTGRINQITILSRPRGGRQVVRFAKVWEIAEAAHDARARRPPPDLCFRDLQPTRPGLGKRACRELKSPRKRSLLAEACSANLLRVARGARAAGFAGLIDLQTLVTHNHTIICGSLKEGLTCSPCARHAQAYCHKKDCVRREVLSEIITTRSFIFLFTASCPIFNWGFQRLFLSYI